MRTTDRRCCMEVKLSPSHRIWAIIASLAGSVRSSRPGGASSLVEKGAQQRRDAPSRENATMDCIHLLGAQHGCATDSPEMTRVQPLRTLCLHAPAASGL